MDKALGLAVTVTKPSAGGVMKGVSEQAEIIQIKKTQRRRRFFIEVCSWKVFNLMEYSAADEEVFYPR